MQRLLIVEDDLFTMRLMKKYFEEEGFIVYKSSDIGGTLNVISSYPIDAIILDINLPSGSSVDTVGEIKKLFDGPIIFYTSDTKSSTELDALNRGGDDLIHKNRGLPILSTRLKKMIEQTKVQDSTYSDSSKVIDLYTHRFIWDGEEYQLSANESKLVNFFLTNKNKLCSRDELSMVIYGFPYDGVGRGLDIMVSRTRKKLQNITNNQIKITPIRGKGYRLSM